MELHEPFFVQNPDHAFYHELFVRDDHPHMQYTYRHR